MSYKVSIIRASIEYEGAAWVAYVATFRRQAAAMEQRVIKNKCTQFVLLGRHGGCRGVRPVLAPHT